ncbi:hypothetical protein Sjap_010583 [Stephania japonica]|uniref:Homeobox-leucine zipper protein n=1 Tax=Stephania japonica TaxID=461633 RepID=A0AAP0JBR3_9MAGN
MEVCGSTDLEVCLKRREKSGGGRERGEEGREGETELENGKMRMTVWKNPGHVSEKKRRLSIDQVKALEKNFEVENKLEPERKVKLAQELGLQPRQVAVWFQNRCARWKTKQLENGQHTINFSICYLVLNIKSCRGKCVST